MTEGGSRTKKWDHDSLGMISISSEMGGVVLNGTTRVPVGGVVVGGLNKMTIRSDAKTGMYRDN